MLTRIKIRHFKLFEEVELDLGQHVVLAGPNNSGKTSLLQAIALWEIGLKKWLANKSREIRTTKRLNRITINRNDLTALPVPSSNQLWHQLQMRSIEKTKANKVKTNRLLIEITVHGLDWSCGFEFHYANSESIYCRPFRTEEQEIFEIPKQAGKVKISHLPSMSGLIANELRLDLGAIDVRLGEDQWEHYCNQIDSLFGVRLIEPVYIGERGEITMAYKNNDGVLLDLSASGRGQQQTMLLMAHMMLNPGSVLLLDEPDAHLEILRQRQIYSLLKENAEQTNSQIIAATHSEILLNEAAWQDTLIEFTGKPRTLNGNRTSQIVKSLSGTGFEHYLSAEKLGWVLYLEGPNDLVILRALAKILNHPAKYHLEAPFVHYVSNQPSKAKAHFHGLLVAKSNLWGIAIFDRLEKKPDGSPNFIQTMWRMREIENYICQREAILKLAKFQGVKSVGPLFAENWQDTMKASIEEIEQAINTIGKPSPWGPEIKASDDFLEPLFKNFYNKLKLPEQFFKKDYHQLVQFLKKDSISEEVVEKLDAIVNVADRANSSKD